MLPAFLKYKLDHAVSSLQQLCFSVKSSPRQLKYGWKRVAEGTTFHTASRLNGLETMFLIRSVTGCDIINGGGSLRGITGWEVKSSFSLCPNLWSCLITKSVHI